MKTALRLLALCLPLLSPRAELSLEFQEAFADPATREQSLALLVPGSPEFYFHSALHQQLLGNADKVAQTLEAFKKRHPDHPLADQIAFRQTLLNYEKDPAGVKAELIRRFGLFFGHAREDENPASSAPTRLDPAFVSGERLLQEALRQGNLGQVTDEGLWKLDAARLSPAMRRELLGRISDPTYPGLAGLIVADLKHEHSAGFGSLKAHEGLTLAQLMELREAHRPLRDNEAFVTAVLERLAPGGDESPDRDPAVRRAWLDRQWEFVSGLSPAFNTLKAGVLYGLLDLDRSEGRYDAARFTEYIKIPRQVGYINPAMRHNLPGGHYARFEGENPGRIAPIPQGEPLVQDYLDRLLAGMETPEAFAPYFEEKWLRATHATARILAGQGNAEALGAVLSPAQFAALRDRVEILFPASNPRLFAPADGVKISVEVKNTPTLLVKVFELNLPNFLRDEEERPGLDLDLDGLAATREFQIEVKEPPLRRVRRELEFPEMKGRGAWIVELIGGGQSSRALITKGRLEMVARAVPDGQEVRVFDEAGNPLKDAIAWFGGKEYRPEADGVLLIPFSTDPSPNRTVILTVGNFADLALLNHQPENWTLNAGFHVDREDLLPGNKARLLVRPILAINGQAAAIGTLEEPRLVITATLRTGASVVEEVRGLKFADGKELVHEVRVPDGLSSLAVELRGKVRRLTDSEPAELSSSAGWQANRLAAEPLYIAPRLTRDADGYALELRGMNGELMPGRAVQLDGFQHAWSRVSMAQTLATDAAGRISLGELADLRTAQFSFEGNNWTFAFDRQGVHAPAVVHAVAGGEVNIPVRDGAAPSLLLLAGDRFPVEDLGRLVKVTDGMASVQGLPAGDYLFRAGPAGAVTRIVVARGEPKSGWVFSPARVVELSLEKPVQIAPITRDGDAWVIRVLNATADTRVHVCAAHHLGGFDLGSGLGGPAAPAPQQGGLPPVFSQYASGRELGDEYRYVLERRGLKPFPGLMLPKPGLILNPWERSVTHADRENLGLGGDPFGAGAEMGEHIARGGSYGGMAKRVGRGGGPNLDFLDFLAAPALVLPNLVPGKDGTVRIKHADLGGRPVLQIAAVTLDQVVSRTAFADRTPPKTLDLRLDQPFAADKKIAEQKVVGALNKGDEIRLPLSAGNDLKIIGNLSQAFDYLQALRSDPTLDLHRFILGWSKLESARKRELYSKHACHELTFFLYHQDRAFFDEVIRPYLANKRDKTFLDLWLLEADLTGFLDPWAFGRLNTVEQILLARRIPAAREGIVRRIADQVEMLPKDRPGWNRRFDTALLVGGLADSSIVDKAKEEMAFKDSSGKLTDRKRASFANKALAERAEIAPTVEAEMAADMSPPPAPATPAPPPAAARPARRAPEEKKQAEALYLKPRDTREWAENNYRNLLPSQQGSELVLPLDFWLDYARHDGATPFLSRNLGQASRNFTEAMLALAVTGLPFEDAPAKVEARDGVLVVSAGGPCLVFRKEIRETPADPNAPAVVMSRQFFDPADRFRMEEGEQVEKTLVDGFVKQRVIGARVVVSNPTSRPRRLTVLLQIPAGAVPVASGFEHRGVVADIAPFGVWQQEYFFVFPQGGKFPQAPTFVAEKDSVVASGDGRELVVLERPEGVDTQSWPHVSQRGTDAEVLEFLQTRNLQPVDLERIAFRMKDRAFFEQALVRLRVRRAFSPVLWSYGFQHGDTASMREWLSASGATGLVGGLIDSPLLRVDPVERMTYEHLEYAPLINARAHPVGGRIVILNAKFKGQYEAFLRTLACRASLQPRDHLAWAAYLLAQDRVADAITRFARVDRKGLAESMQADYLEVCLRLLQGDLDGAEAVAKKRADTPVDRWREKFTAALAHIAEARGAAVAPAAGKDGPDNQAAAAVQPALDLKAQKGVMEITHRRLDACRVSYYPMDVELLFSKKPFLRDYGAGFSFVRPVRSDEIALKGAASPLSIPVPDEFKGRNVAIEVVAGGLRSVATRLDSRMTVEKIESYGEVRVLNDKSSPLPAAYVKVFARRGDGQVLFHKDGYTDLRGRFDYASVNGDGLDNAEVFSILILSPEHGAVILEAAPPRR